MKLKPNQEMEYLLRGARSWLAPFSRDVKQFLQTDQYMCRDSQLLSLQKHFLQSRKLATGIPEIVRSKVYEVSWKYFPWARSMRFWFWGRVLLRAYLIGIKASGCFMLIIGALFFFQFMDRMTWSPGGAALNSSQAGSQTPTFCPSAKLIRAAQNEDLCTSISHWYFESL